MPSEEEEEEGRASHLPGKMRSLPKGAHNKRTRAVRDGGLRRQNKVWLVTAVGGGKRVGEHNNQPKEGCAGRRAPKRKGGNVSEGGGGGDCGGEGDGGSVCCGEVRGNDGDDDNDENDDDNDDNEDEDDNDGCIDVGGGCGDGDSGGKGDGGGDGCSKFNGDGSNYFGCCGNGYCLR